jgi:NADH-quinone oxidoreductase subunit G
LARSRDFLEARAILVVGNDPTEQHPLLAYNIRQAVRRGGADLFIINHRPIKLERQARKMAVIPEGTMGEAIEQLLSGSSSLPHEIAAELIDLRAVLDGSTSLTIIDAAREVVVALGSEVTGETVHKLVAFATAGGRKAKVACLGDYVNSRGASDMGVTPEFLPGYIHTSKPGLSSQEILRNAGRIRALHVVGSDPATQLRLPSDWRSKFEFVVVQDLFLTATAREADVVFPAASLYEKDGTVTNTYGEVQSVKQAIQRGGIRTDFDIIRILAHLLGSELGLKSPEAAWEEIRAKVPGYDVSTAELWIGHACMTEPIVAEPRRRIAVEGIVSAQDTLFTSGTLGEYCEMIRSLPEAQAGE